VGSVARGLIAICAGFFLATGWTQPELRPLPLLLRSVSDEVGALSDAQGKALSKFLQDIFESTSVRIIMVIAETTKPEPVEDYAERLARRWSRERALDPTRAVFVIVAVDDREMQVLPGSALRLDAELTDPSIARNLVPLFRERRYFEALMKLTQRLRGILEGNKPVKSI
jgi:uncharacterized protein